MRRSEHERLAGIFNGKLPDLNESQDEESILGRTGIGSASPARVELYLRRLTRPATKNAVPQPCDVLKVISRTYKQHMLNYAAVLGQQKKIATICARELRRGLSRTSKTNPFLKNKRINKELQKRLAKQQREERDTRKREEVERETQRRIAEQEREELRQQHKFNYLMSQTEAFASFFLNRQSHTEGVASVAAQQQLAHLREFNSDKDEERGSKPASQSSYQYRTVKQPEMLKARLRNYQLKGLNWLANLYSQGINGILADDMGLGKTIQAISLLGWLAESEDIWGPFLVVTPASTLHNWENEFTRFIPAFKVVVYYGSLSERAELRRLFKKANVVITSYQVAVMDESFLKKIKWQYMILDEAQAIKSIASQRWNTLLAFKARSRCLLTGTPIQNNMQELWSLLHFIMPTLFDSLAEFKEWFLMENQVDASQISKLHTILKPFMLRRHKEDIKDEIGTKEIVHVYCEMSSRQRTLYDSVRSKLAGCGAQDVENVLMQLKKVCNHPSLFDRPEAQTAFSMTLSGTGTVEACGALMRYVPGAMLVNSRVQLASQACSREVVGTASGMVRAGLAHRLSKLKQFEFATPRIKRQRIESNLESEAALFFSSAHPPSSLLDQPLSSRYCRSPPLSSLIADSGKLAALDGLLGDLLAGNHRVLIYFQMTRMMDLFEEYLVQRGFSYIRLDGSVRVSTRKELVARWQAGDVFIFILSTRAGGVGINLTAADTVIFYDSDWNPTVDQQAMDRAHRLGQKKPVTVYRLITRESIEEKIIERANKKDEMQKIVIKGHVFSH